MPDSGLHSKIFLQDLCLLAWNCVLGLVSRNVSEEWGAYIQGWKVQEALNPWSLRDHVPSKRRKTVTRHTASYPRRLRSSATRLWKFDLVFVQLCNVTSIRNLSVRTVKNYLPYFSIDNAHLKYNAHPKLFRHSFWCIDNAHDVFFDR